MPLLGMSDIFGDFMSFYGVLKTNTNTGLDSELEYVFSTPLTVRSNQPAFISDTMSLKRRTNAQGVQRWEIEAAIVPTNDNTSGNFLVHSAVNGLTNIIFVRMPQIFVNDNQKINENMVLNTTQALLKGDTACSLSGLGGIPLYRGLFVQFNGNSKVYLVTSANGSNITFTPPLLTNISGGTQLLYGSKVTLHARYDSDTTLGIKYVDGVLADNGTIKFVEAL